MLVRSRGETVVGRFLKGWWLLLLALVVAACSGDSSEGAEAESGPKPTKAASAEPDLHYEIGAPEGHLKLVSFGEDGEEPETPLGYTSPEDLIERGVELGVWDEAEALTVALKILVGELPESTIDVWDTVVSESFSGVVARASAAVDDPTIDEADRAELERLLEVAIPPVSQVFPERDGSGDPDDSAAVGSLVRVAQGDACLEPKLDAFAEVEARRDVDCWKVISERVRQENLRVIFPEGREDQAAAALEAMVLVAEAAEGWTAKGSDSSLLLTPASNPDSLGLATVNPRQIQSDECVISLFAGSFAAGDSEAYFRQIVAHEQVHCLQFASFSDLGGKETDWVVEAIAELYSHLMVPDGGHERPLISTFLAKSLESPLDAMSYENWVWWQFLVNDTSAAQVWELQGHLLKGGLARLGTEPEIDEKFQRFTIDLMTVGVPTRSQPVPPSSLGRERLSISGTGQHDVKVAPFVALRLGATWIKEHLFLQDDHTATGGLTQMAPVEERMDRAAWRGLPPELRTACNTDSRYLAAITTTKTEAHTFTFQVTEAEKYGCDSCLGGTWVVDNQSFADAIMGTVASAGGLPAGASVSVDLVGDYFVRFDGEGDMRSWRNGYEIRSNATVHGHSQTVVVTTDSIETGSYGADGQRFTAWDSATIDYRAFMTTNGMSVAVSPDESSYSMFGVSGQGPGGGLDGATSAAGDYVCDKQHLEITLDEFNSSPIRFIRVKDIPEPPTVLPEPNQG